MKLNINAIITEDDGTVIVTESLVFDGNKSGVIHAIKPMGESLIYSLSLGIFYKKNIPMKDALGNLRQIVKDVVDIVEVKKEDSATATKQTK